MKLTLEEAKKMMEANGGNLDLSWESSITELPDNLTVDGWLDLRYTQITALPNNLTVGRWLDLSYTPITKFPNNLTVGESLWLNCTKVATLPDNLTVGCTLDLRCTQITALPDNLTVGGSLVLRGTRITELPDNLIVGWGLDLRDTQITALPENLTVGGWLDLRGTQITSLPENLTVGGWLDLRGTQITSLPDNLTVGGCLDLRYTPITVLPDSLMVGGYVNTYETRISRYEADKIRYLKDGTYVKGHYLYADGLLTHVEKAEKSGQYTIYHGKIPCRNVVSDGVNYAHCKNIQDGIADLEFKAAKDRGASQYEGLPLDTELSVSDAVIMYRIITGACKQGSEDFVRSLGQLKEKYTIRECIEITEGQYNAEEFAEFFGC